MNTKLLTTLLAVHQYGSMAEAARRLNLTHGTIAQQIRALEGDLGVRLVRRAGKVVHITQAAHRILDASQKIIAEVDTLAALANTGELRGEFSLGTGNTVLAGKVPDILETLGTQYPEIQVRIMSGQSPDFHTQVERGILDAAIALEPSFTSSKAMGWHLLYEEPFVMIASQRHKDADPHQLLKQEPFIRYHRESWAGQQIDTYLRQNNIVPRERFELASTEAITRLVHKDLGVAVVPSAWHQWENGLSVVSLPLNTPCSPRKFGLIWLRSSPRLRLIEAFLDAAILTREKEHTN
ncbi:LysR family transcriptional regulator [Candidimonas nitroreducens]|uniref:LysR family transcriptional regulator n=1 Tax=Candidimonas nitroreducens TaxID=683354 RepID=A0A225MRN9_9BURK|nr:LysR family transcriptional regulator [Candidimonas nitroreducens]OWT63895.1 LysR family transcriptional regulator [Candidimonas nitroreducens]